MLLEGFYRFFVRVCAGAIIVKAFRIKFPTRFIISSSFFNSWRIMADTDNTLAATSLRILSNCGRAYSWICSVFASNAWMISVALLFSCRAIIFSASLLPSLIQTTQQIVWFIRYAIYVAHLDHCALKSHRLSVKIQFDLSFFLLNHSAVVWHRVLMVSVLLLSLVHNTIWP